MDLRTSDRDFVCGLSWPDIRWSTQRRPVGSGVHDGADNPSHNPRHRTDHAGETVSWAAHELESYVIQKHLKTKASYLAILIGCLGPDMLTKLPVYGLKIGGHQLVKASFPAKYHRGWPGVGPTHSLFFGALVGILVLWLSKNRAWAIGLVVGIWSHVLTDVFDSVGTMMFFPFTTQHYSTGLWAYASQAGRYGDAAAYYSSFGGVWDLFWLIMIIRGRDVLTKQYFFTKVVADDPAWGWLRRKFRMSDRAMLATYRAFFIYGGSRIFGWFFWARFFNPNRGEQKMSLVLKGPSWVQHVSFPAANWGEFALNTVRGVVGLGAFFALLWFVAIKRLWAHAV